MTDSDTYNFIDSPSFYAHLKCLLYSFVFITFVSYIILSYIPFVPYKFSSMIKIDKKCVLIVIAHPDDEVMFFGPTIANLVRTNKIHLLCLTSGNYYNIGDVRKTELLKSAEILGISPSRVYIVDKKEIADDPKIEWYEGLVTNEIIQVLLNAVPEVIISFDSYGVSGHQNHSQCYRVIRNMLQYEKDHERIKRLPAFYSLDSIPIWRKYISFLDVPFSLLFNKNIFIASVQQVLLTQKAMYAHRSQLMWFRRLYIIFSRYMFINTFTELDYPL